MINFEICLLEELTFFKKTNANNKRSIKKFFSEMLHLKPINHKKQVVKKKQMNSNMKMTHEFLMSKKCKTKLRMIGMKMVDLLISMMIIMRMKVMLKLKMMIMIIIMMIILT